MSPAVRPTCAWYHACGVVRSVCEGRRSLAGVRRVAHARVLQEKEDWINAVGRAIVRHSKRRAPRRRAGAGSMSVCLHARCWLPCQIKPLWPKGSSSPRVTCRSTAEGSRFPSARPCLARMPCRPLPSRRRAHTSTHAAPWPERAGAGRPPRALSRAHPCCAACWRRTKGTTPRPCAERAARTRAAVAGPHQGAWGHACRQCCGGARARGGAGAQFCAYRTGGAVSCAGVDHTELCLRCMTGAALCVTL